MLTEFGAREGTSGPSSLHPQNMSSRAEAARNSNFKRGHCGTAKSCALPFFPGPRRYIPRLLTRFSGEHWLCLEAGFCRWLPLLQRPQPVLERFHVNVENGGDIQSHKLGEEQSADHGQAQRAARLGPGAKAQSDRQGTHQGSHSGHHDGTEAEEGTLIDGFL